MDLISSELRLLAATETLDTPEGQTTLEAALAGHDAALDEYFRVLAERRPPS